MLSYRPQYGGKGCQGHVRGHYKTCNMQVSNIIILLLLVIDDYAKDGGEELFTKMHCVLITNP